MLFVTHDVNPVLHLVDRVLFVVNGRWAAGTPDEVLTSDRLSELYGSHVDVLRVHDRILVVGDSTGAGFDLGRRTGSFVLLWITDPGPANQAQVNEVSLST